MDVVAETARAPRVERGPYRKGVAAPPGDRAGRRPGLRRARLQRRLAAQHRRAGGRLVRLARAVLRDQGGAARRRARGVGAREPTRRGPTGCAAWPGCAACARRWSTTPPTAGLIELFLTLTAEATHPDAPGADLRPAPVRDGRGRARAATCTRPSTTARWRRMDEHRDRAGGAALRRRDGRHASCSGCSTRGSTCSSSSTGSSSRPWPAGRAEPGAVRRTGRRAWVRPVGRVGAPPAGGVGVEPADGPWVPGSRRPRVWCPDWLVGPGR